MEIHFKEPEGVNVLSKMQKQKLRRKIKEMWISEEKFLDQIEEVLATIHYPETCVETEKYNMIKFDYDSMTNRLELEMQNIREETSEERRARLVKKLRESQTRRHSRPSSAASSDPRWEMYEKIRNHVPQGQRNMIPDPDSVSNNLEMYRTMLTMIPAQNPLHKYISMFIPPS
jgi:hypothetical protein